MASGVSLFSTICQHEHLSTLTDRFKECFRTASHARIATALVLWRNHNWSSILKRLDDHHHKQIALEVVQHQYAPVSVVDDELLVKRWVDVALTGQHSKTFNPAEEKKILTTLRAFAFEDDRDGSITNIEAKSIIGLGSSKSESVQLSNLFRKWQEQGNISLVKRGVWQFQVRNRDVRVITTKKIVIKDTYKAHT